jgi:hypothetical protein
MVFASLFAQRITSTVLALFQGGDSMSGTGMGLMMTACVLFGVVLFIAFVELVILELLWIKLWRQRLRNESTRSAGSVGRAA